MKPPVRPAAPVLAVVVLSAVTACSTGAADTISSSSQPAAQSTAGLDPRLREALDVATAFTEGRSERDIERMSANSTEGFINGLVVLSLGQMPAEFAWQEAVGWTMEVEGCEVTHADERRPSIRCDVIHENAISQALGVGPYPDSYHIKVLFPGDEILGVPITATSVSESHQSEFPIEDFTTETWRPFVEWLGGVHPEDVDRMLGPPIEPGVEFLLVAGERRPLLDDESISLWRRHVRQFASESRDG